MQVEITRFAKRQLKQIYEYYKSEASERIAAQIINKLFDAIDELEKLSGIGSIEPNLAHLMQNYRYLVCGNYKIIFRAETDMIYVTDVFDCRQNPVKIARRNK